MRLNTERTDHFPFGPDEFWERVGHLDQFQWWWPWLKQFDGRRLAAGDVWTCAVQPPVPYVVRFTITLDRIDHGHSIAAHIDGDITGFATLSVAPAPSGCQTTLVAQLAPDKRSLRVMSIAARPIVQFGHNWVLDAGVCQFRTKSGSVT